MAEIKIGRMVLGVCQTNCYFIYRTGASEVIVIDPADNGDKIANALERNGFSVAGILITHGHFDHILGCEKLKAVANERAEKIGSGQVLVYVCEAERELLGDARLNLSKGMSDAYTMEADVYVKEGEEITIAGITRRDIPRAVVAITLRRRGF